jgi:hypothetical protein
MHLGQGRRCEDGAKKPVSRTINPSSWTGGPQKQNGPAVHPRRAVVLGHPGKATLLPVRKRPATEHCRTETQRNHATRTTRARFPIYAQNVYIVQILKRRQFRPRRRRAWNSLNDFVLVQKQPRRKAEAWNAKLTDYDASRGHVDLGEPDCAVDSPPRLVFACHRANASCHRIISRTREARWFCSRISACAHATKRKSPPGGPAGRVRRLCFGRQQ